jgi:hypothetical protein
MGFVNYPRASLIRIAGRGSPNKNSHQNIHYASVAWLDSGKLGFILIPYAHHAGAVHLDFVDFDFAARERFAPDLDCLHIFRAIYFCDQLHAIN